MKIFKKMNAYLDVFKKGQKLANAGTWKNRAVVQNLIVGLIGAIMVIAQLNGFTVAEDLDEANLEVLASVLITLIGIINGAVFTATSSKVGINPKEMLQTDDTTEDGKTPTNQD